MVSPEKLGEQATASRATLNMAVPEHASGPEDGWCLSRSSYRFHKSFHRKTGRPPGFGEYTRLKRCFRKNKATIIVPNFRPGLNLHEAMTTDPGDPVLVLANEAGVPYCVLGDHDLREVRSKFWPLGRSLFQHYGILLDTQLALSWKHKLRQAKAHRIIEAPDTENLVFEVREGTARHMVTVRLEVDRDRHHRQIIQALPPSSA